MNREDLNNLAYLLPSNASVRVTVIGEKNEAIRLLKQQLETAGYHGYFEVDGLTAASLVITDKCNGQTGPTRDETPSSGQNGGELHCEEQSSSDDCDRQQSDDEVSSGDGVGTV